MAFKSEYKTKKTGFESGIGLVMVLDEELPRKYDEKKMGGDGAKGFVLTGKVVEVLGQRAKGAMPGVGERWSVTVRPGDDRKVIFADLEKTKEGSRFLLEGVTGDVDAMTARWVHGAGANREIRAVELIGVPHVTFENPVPKDGPFNGMLRMNLDGSPTEYDVRVGEGVWERRELSFDTMVARLKAALEKGLHFRVTQRVLAPSKAVLVDGQEEFEAVLTAFRKSGYTSCVVRTFIPGTTDPSQVDVQVLSWPDDIPAKGDAVGKTFELPVLKETKKFAALRDGAAVASMEVVPGYELALIGNPTDHDKSAKHKFVNDIVGKGLSDGQKGMYGSQSYGPGITIRAVNDEGTVLGLLRLATRTEGPQIRGLMQIPTEAFPDADKIDFSAGKGAPADDAVLDAEAKPQEAEEVAA